MPTRLHLAVLIAVIASASGCARSAVAGSVGGGFAGDRAPATAHPGGTDITARVVGDEPYGIAVRSDGLIYVARGNSSALARLQLPSVTTFPTIATGSERTTDVVFVRGKARAYTANMDVEAVSVISTETHALLRTLPAGGKAIRVKASPAGDYVFASTDEGTVRRFNTAEDEISTLVLGQSGVNGLAVNPARGVLYASDYAGTLYEISLATFTVGRKVLIGGRLQGIAVAPDGARLFVAAEDLGTKILDATTLAAGGAFGPAAAFDVAVTTDGAEVYVAATQEDLVSVHRAATGEFIRAHHITSPRRIGFSADGRTAIVASQDGAVWFIR